MDASSRKTAKAFKSFRWFQCVSGRGDFWRLHDVSQTVLNVFKRGIRAFKRNIKAFQGVFEGFSFHGGFEAFQIVSGGFGEASGAFMNFSELSREHQGVSDGL